MSQIDISNTSSKGFNNTIVKGILITLALGLIVQLFLPWWSMAVTSFLVGIWLYESPIKSFLYGTIAMALLWSVYAMMLSSGNGGIMNAAIAKMLGGKISGTQLIYATGLIGGLVSGMAAMTGSFLKQILLNRD